MGKCRHDRVIVRGGIRYCYQCDALLEPGFKRPKVPRVDTLEVELWNDWKSEFPGGQQ